MQILPINNQYKIHNITFQGQIIKNPVLDSCLKHFSSKQFGEYQNLKSIADTVNDGKILETYERTTTADIRDKIVYLYYVGIRDTNSNQNLGEELVKKTSKEGSATIFYGYVDAILKPLRNLYNNGKMIESFYFNK